MADRTDKDYAIEHAGYMAEAAKGYLEAVGNHLFAQMKDDEEGTRATSDAVDETRDALVDAGLTLSNRIYEFEKRRDRAAAALVKD